MRLIALGKVGIGEAKEDNVRRWMLIAGWAVLMGGVGDAVAGEPGDVQKQLDELKAKVDALEKKQAQPPATAPAAEPKGSLWTDRVKLFGDLRLRGDYIDKPRWDTETADRERLRFRARVGLEAKVNEEVNLRFRIATDESTSSENGADPVSANQTMTNYGSKKAVWWDLAMFDYHPAVVPGLRVLGGKIEQPFFTAGKNEMVWDNNLAPEGGAIKYQPKIALSEDQSLEPMAIAGAFWLKERSTLGTDTADSGLFGGQLGLKYNLSKNAYVLGGGGYFDYVHAKDFPVFDYSGGTANFGNSVSPDNEYRFDYNLAEAFAEVGFPCPLTSLPVTVFGDWVKNTAVSKNAQAYLGGVRLGKIEKQWDWALCYDYRRVEKDSLIGAFAKCDIFGQGADGRGHRYGAELQLMKNLSLGAYYLQGKANIAREDVSNDDESYRRAQLEIIFKF